MREREMKEKRKGGRVRHTFHARGIVPKESLGSTLPPFQKTSKPDSN
jgi:hypothetical protein